MALSSMTTSPKPDDGPMRAEGLWFEDCGLIIRAEDTIFRVSGAILVVQSTVFRDMLSLPTPENQETLDGCPQVFLLDTAEDVLHFLRAVFCYGFFDPFHSSTNFPILSSVLRMAHKYEADELQKRALIHLSKAHPTTLIEWDFMDDDVAWAEEKALDIAAIARQIGADWVLPTSFYRICQSAFEDRIITRHELSDADKINCIKGIRYLETTGAADILQFLLDCYYNCWTSGDCSASRQEMLRNVARLGKYDGENMTVMPLELWRRTHWSDLDVCEDCLVYMKETHKDAQQKLWSNLPKIFGLDDWKQLEAMKAEALK
ncbi:hypothetical protein B0H14DRAFT_3552578 [Mycena olivaceomarginata]|nr:hypothetical protein B0H14DRAFT_3552578 [Mycena olivaceomarginata]